MAENPETGLAQVTTLTSGLRDSRSKSPYEVPRFARIYERLIADVTHGATGRVIHSEIESFASNGARVLDVGAGTGKDALELARRRHDMQVVGADPYGPMLDRARAAPDQPQNLSWTQAGADALPFDAGSFDAVYSANALKHFPDPRAAIAEMLRVLRPGGRLWVAEVSPYVSLRSTWTVARRVRLPFFLRPFLALKLRGETRKLLPGRDVVEEWFADHPNTETFVGLDHLESQSERPAAFFVARLVRNP